MISPSTVLIATLALGVVSTLGAPYLQPEPQAIARRYPEMARDLFDPFQSRDEAINARTYPERTPKCECKPYQARHDREGDHCRCAPTNSFSGKRPTKSHSIHKSRSARPTKSSPTSKSAITSNASSDPVLTSNAPSGPPAPTSISAPAGAPSASVPRPSQSAQLPAPSSGAAVVSSGAAAPPISNPPAPEPTGADDVEPARRRMILEARQEADGFDLVDPGEITLEGRGESIVTAHVKVDSNGRAHGVL